MAIKDKIVDKELASLGYGYGLTISPFQQHQLIQCLLTMVFLKILSCSKTKMFHRESYF